MGALTEDGVVGVVAGQSLVAKNQVVRDWAREVAPDDRSRWEFVCECGDPDCAEHVKLTLDLYDRLRQNEQPILAPGHILDRARAARGWAREVRAEARAVHNQAQQQVRRSDRLGRLREYVVLTCGQCGYGVCVPDPPTGCPMCHAEDWRTTRTP